MLVIKTKEDLTMSGRAENLIQFTALDSYIGEPVWDSKVDRWRVLVGYRRYGDTREVIFTDSKSMEAWESVELTTSKVVKEKTTERPEW